MSMQGDLLSITTYDGKKLFFSGQIDAIFAFFGFGSPPVDFQTRRGYKQDGVTEIGYALSPRNISLSIYRSPACSRVEYWQKRTDLLNFLRHNRNGPMTVTLRQPTGTTRAITVRANPGPQLDVPQDRNGWDIEETIDFIAFDPLFFDPAAADLDIVGIFDQNLIFPITFPIVFGLAGLIFTLLVTYTGTWITYPIFTIDGPYTSIRIENVTTGIAIGLNIPIAAGEQRIIDLTPGRQRIYDQNGVNRFSELTPESNLVDFNLRPDPEVPNGVQTIRATLYASNTFFPSGWVQAVTNDQPIHWYRLGETSGTLANDIGSSPSIGTYGGSYQLGVPSLVSGDPSNLALGYKASKEINAAGDTTLGNGRDFTVEAWIDATNTAGVPQTLVAIGGGTAGVGQHVWLGILDTGALWADFGTSGGVVTTSAGLVTIGAINHIVYTYVNSTNTIDFYVNGVLVATGNIGPAILPAPITPPYNFAYNNGINYLGGILDELVIYGSALSAVRVLAHFTEAAIPADGSAVQGVNMNYYNRYFGI